MAGSGRAGHGDEVSLYHLLDPWILANPYPLYRRLRRRDPVHWDPFLHAWVVTSYREVIAVFQRFSADRAFSTEQLSAMGLADLNPIAQLMVRQMLFLDPPAHTRVRGLASKAFTPRRVEHMRGHIEDIAESLIDAVQPAGRMDVIADLAFPLPAIVTAEMLGVPAADRQRLKAWSADFAEMLGNFQHNPNRAQRVLASVEAMTAYFRDALRNRPPGDNLLSALAEAEVAGDRLSEEEIIANCIITMVGGQETTTNLIGNGLLSLLRHPAELERPRRDPSLLPSAVEELLRFESPSQHTARVAREDTYLGGKSIRAGQAVIAVMAAANRDPERFPHPDRLDLARADNRHVAFGWGGHFCFGAPLARLEGQIVFAALLRRLSHIELDGIAGPLRWRANLGLRGLESLPVRFTPAP